MAISIDLNSTNPLLKRVAKVRDKVGQPHIIFDDDSYISDLEDCANNIFKAAAIRLLAIANSEAFIQKVQETLQLKTDGAKLADSYRASAKMLLAMVADGDVVAPEEPSSARQGKSIMPRRVDGYSRNGC